MRNILLASAVATVFCVSLAAQDRTQTPSPSPSAPPIASPTTGATTPQAPRSVPPASTTPQSAKADSITVEGCIQRGGGTASSTAGATGTAGSSSSDAGFILSSVAKPAGTSGSSAAAQPASSYRLDADSSKLTPHVGHKVEISGTVESDSSASATSSGGSASASASSVPKLKVDNVRMIAATCTP